MQLLSDEFGAIPFNLYVVHYVTVTSILTCGTVLKTGWVRIPLIVTLNSFRTRGFNEKYVLFGMHRFMFLFTVNNTGTTEKKVSLISPIHLQAEVILKVLQLFSTFFNRSVKTVWILPRTNPIRSKKIKALS